MSDEKELFKHVYNDSLVDFKKSAKEVITKKVMDKIEDRKAEIISSINGVEEEE